MFHEETINGKIKELVKALENMQQRPKYQLFTTGEIAKALRLPMHRVMNFAAKEKYGIKPSIVCGRYKKGGKIHRYYGLRQVIEFGLAFRLQTFGLKPSGIKRILEAEIGG